jgi:hypothetical protein
MNMVEWLVHKHKKYKKVKQNEILNYLKEMKNRYADYELVTMDNGIFIWRKK